MEAEIPSADTTVDSPIAPVSNGVINGETNKMNLVSPSRKYAFGMDRKRRPYGRVWIDFPDDPSMVNLYTLDYEEENKKVYACGQCRQHRRNTLVEIRSGDPPEIYEDVTHFVSCKRYKDDVERCQSNIVNPGTPSSPANRKRRGRSSAGASQRKRKPPTRSLNGATPISNDNKYRGRRPNMDAMKAVPSTNWKLVNFEAMNETTKLYIYTDPHSNIGRVFSITQPFEDGVFFHCDNCWYLTREQQKRKAFVQKVNGETIVREANHYATCKPYNIEEGNNNIGNGENISTEQATRSLNGATPVVRQQPQRQQPSRPQMQIISPKTNGTVTIQATTTTTPSTPVHQNNTNRIQRSRSPAPVRDFQRAKSIFHHHIPAASSSAYFRTQSVAPNPLRTTLPTPKQFQPILLKNNQCIIYNTPSSSTMREIAKIFGFTFNYRCHSFWSSTLSNKIYEIKSTSAPTQTYPTASPSNFAALSMFFSGTEEYFLQIQEVIKRYFFEKYITATGSSSCSFKFSKEIIADTIITNSCNDIHLSILSTMINCTIIVFEGSNIKIFGMTDDETVPTMMLKNSFGKLEPVLDITK